MIMEPDQIEQAARRIADRINQAIADRRLKNVGGQLLETSLEGGLVSSAARLLYPVLDGIPVLLVDEAIPLDQPGLE